MFLQHFVTEVDDSLYIGCISQTAPDADIKNQRCNSMVHSSNGCCAYALGLQSIYADAAKLLQSLTSAQPQ